VQAVAEIPSVAAKTKPACLATDWHYLSLKEDIVLVKNQDLSGF